MPSRYINCDSLVESRISVLQYIFNNTETKIFSSVWLDIITVVQSSETNASNRFKRSDYNINCALSVELNDEKSCLITSLNH